MVQRFLFQLMTAVNPVHDLKRTVRVDLMDARAEPVHDDGLVRVHMITAESPESRRPPPRPLIQFSQLTMPVIAALTPPEHAVSHTDEIVEPVRFDVPPDLGGDHRADAVRSSRLRYRLGIPLKTALVRNP